MSILLNEEARAKIMAGAQMLCDTVKLTIGPKGRNIIIARGGSPLVTNDGVTIAREVSLSDPFENIGAQILVQASLKTNEKVGDGTTSAIVFGTELLRRGMRQIANGFSPVLLKESILTAAQHAVDYINDTARPCDSYEKVLAVAVNSCASEDDGKLVADAIARVGADGVVTIEENTSGTMSLAFSEGMELALEMASPYFCDDPVKMETVFSDAKIVIKPKVISSLKDILNELEAAKSEKQSLVIIADDFTPDVVAALVLNRVHAGLRIVALRANRLGERKGALLGDLEALVEDCCRKVICDMKGTRFITSGGSKLNERIEQIRYQIAESTDEYSTVRLRERLAHLTNGIAVISVGCTTEIEQRERKLRIEDALAAAAAAARDGIVEGGGVTYIRAAQAIEAPDFFKQSLCSVLKQICVNADVVPDIVIDRVAKGEFGFNAITGEYVDMFKADIVDPAGVVKNVIANAASVVATLLTTEGVIVDNTA